MSSASRRLSDPKFLQLHIPGNNHVLDRSGHGRDGTWSGTEAYAAWSMGRSIISLNGVNARIALPSITTTEISLSAWVDITAYPAIEDGILHKNLEYALTINSTGVPKLWLYAGSWSAACSGNAISCGQVAHICATFTGVVASLYQDGQLTSGPTVDLKAQNSNVTYIGYDSATSEYANMRVRDLRIYNIALTGDEVSELYYTTSRR